MNIFIKTYGCALNQHDSQVLSGVLKSKGYFLTNLERAKIVIVMSCGVKSKTEQKIISFIKSLKGKKIFVGGCLPRMLNLRKFAKVNAIFDTNNVLKVIELIEKQKDIFSIEKENRLNRPILRADKDIAIIPIAQGCLGKPCSYCSVKFARGDLKSYEKKDIIKEIQRAIKEKCSKIYLTAQDTGCYGLDINFNLPSLLKEILKLKGNFKIRLGMANPNFILWYLKELIPIFKNKKMIKFLHIPVQSGSDKVLKDMKRDYKIKDFKKIVKEFRKIPGIKISTDIIVGYPTETIKDFEKTLKLIKETKPDIVNISKFTPRPKTHASKLKQIPTQEIKRRSKIISKIIKK